MTDDAAPPQGARYATAPQRDDDGRTLAPGVSDHPDGDAMGWAAADFGPDDWASPDDVDAAPLVADGTQVDGPHHTLAGSDA